MLTIHQTTVQTTDEDNRPSSYVALNASGVGQYVATVKGADKCDLGYGCDGGRVGGQDYCLRDVLRFARRGEHGVTIVE